MAHEATVDLGSFTISSHTDEGFCLTVSTAMSLSLPDNLPSVPTAVELWDQVKDGLLWITRAGSCRFALSIYSEELADDLDHADLHDREREMVMEAFQTFPVSQSAICSRDYVPTDKSRRGTHSDSTFAMK